ncbi:hypothetical protein TP70_04340 [Staphylococcus microti]|uniref:Exported protein n=1 Tax=Staphylococcus microti TaxID=569857 RepID=A0A0D6XQR4_9STAP|nr:DUF4097 family beta strand repeat-containing protein [Staphylococcus microti]KIX91174.1 hypothetical protein TP70_04340 [Staphylococcus microti]PNZ75761.1 hypothetical protein CD132_12000 [Staphylococcus microti]SUM58273.1 exported protein [Staphylococcus microti]
MRKFNVIVLVIGLVVTLIGMTGAFYYSKIDNKYAEQTVKISRTFDAERIKNVELDLRNAKLHIVAGDTFKLEGKTDGKQPKVTTQDGTLKLQLEGEENAQMTVNVNPFHDKTYTLYTLTVPRSEMSRFHLKSDWSYVDIAGVSIKEMAVQLQKGAFSLENSQIGTLDGRMEYGAFDVSDTRLDKVAMTVRKGGATFDNVPADIPMTLDNQYGTIDVSFLSPLQNISITTSNQNGLVDLEDLTHYDSIKQQETELDKVIDIKNNKGTVTLDD